jgi:hypothetical protein
VQADQVVVLTAALLVLPQVLAVERVVILKRLYIIHLQLMHILFQLVERLDPLPEVERLELPALSLLRNIINNFK